MEYAWVSLSDAMEWVLAGRFIIPRPSSVSWLRTLREAVVGRGCVLRVRRGFIDCQVIGHKSLDVWVV